MISIKAITATFLGGLMLTGFTAKAERTEYTFYPRRISTMFDSVGGINDEITFTLPDASKKSVIVKADKRVSIADSYQFDPGSISISYEIRSNYVDEVQAGACTFTLTKEDLKETNQGVRLNFNRIGDAKKNPPPWFDCSVQISHPSL